MMASWSDGHFYTFSGQVMLDRTSLRIYLLPVLFSVGILDEQYIVNKVGKQFGLFAIKNLSPEQQYVTPNFGDC